MHGGLKYPSMQQPKSYFARPRRRHYGRAMTMLRGICRTNPRVALLLVALALAMRGLVPAGLMSVAQGLTLSVAICADTGGGHQTRQIVIPRDGKPGKQSPDGSHGHTACPFTALFAAGLGSAPASVTAPEAFAFALIVAVSTVVPALRRTAFLRPPLRAPPSCD